MGARRGSRPSLYGDLICVGVKIEHLVETAPSPITGAPFEPPKLTRA